MQTTRGVVMWDEYDECAAAVVKLFFVAADEGNTFEQLGRYSQAIPLSG
jgi:hypothetical protein